MSLDVTTVLVAAIAAGPPTLAIIYGNRKSKTRADELHEKVDGNTEKIDEINEAVNNQPVDAFGNKPASLVRMVKSIHRDTLVTNAKLLEVDKRLVAVEEKVG